jgi:ABC-2 type transport system permease protein
VSAQGLRPDTSPERPTGSIYDLGYRRYEGRRLGRPGAFVALTIDALRACFGLGRPARAKVIPIGLLVLALLPAVVAVALEALARGAIPNPIRYDNYFSTIVQLLVLFVAAQAPELVGRDQRYGSLSLVFSRALERLDYPLAKLLALGTALLIVSLLPQAGIFLGKVLGAEDVVEALTDNLASVPAIVLSSVLAAGVMAGLALAVAAFTPRRAYATAGIFAVFYVSLAVAAVIAEVARRSRDSIWQDVAPLLAPTATLDGLIAWLFDSRVSGSVASRSDLPGPVYLVASLALIAASMAVLAWRYRGIRL